jgi:hypothetical protein
MQWTIEVTLNIDTDYFIPRRGEIAHFDTYSTVLHKYFKI